MKTAVATIKYTHQLVAVRSLSGLLSTALLTPAICVLVFCELMGVGLVCCGVSCVVAVFAAGVFCTGALFTGLNGIVLVATDSDLGGSLLFFCDSGAD